MDLGSFLLPRNAKAILWMMKLPNQRNRSMHPWLRINIPEARRKSGLKTCASWLHPPRIRKGAWDCSCLTLLQLSYGCSIICQQRFMVQDKQTIPMCTQSDWIILDYARR